MQVEKSFDLQSFSFLSHYNISYSFLLFMHVNLTDACKMDLKVNILRANKQMVFKLKLSAEYPLTFLSVMRRRPTYFTSSTSSDHKHGHANKI